MKKVICFMIALSVSASLFSEELKHVVAKGETLRGIASQYGVDEKDLIKANPDAKRYIYSGMSLVIPLDGYFEDVLFNKCITAADAWYSQGKYPKAASFYEKALDVKLDDHALLYAALSYYKQGMYKKALGYASNTRLSSNKDLDVRQTAGQIKEKSREILSERMQEKADARRELLQSLGNTLAATTASMASSMAFSGQQYHAPQSYQWGTYSSAWDSRGDALFRQNGLPTPDEYMNGARFNHQVPACIAGTPRGISMAAAINNQEYWRQETEAFHKYMEESNKALSESVMKHFREWKEGFIAINGREPDMREIDMFYQSAYNPDWPPGTGSIPGSDVLPSTTAEGSGTHSSGNYQIDYDYYAKVAEMYYNSATLGHNTTDSSGNYNSTTSSSLSGSPVGENAASTFMSQFKIAQNNMRRIRTEAASRGVNITKSPWETAVLKY